MSTFSVYKASAGSGKTFTLVKEYLKIALSDKATPPFKYKQILAVTFTNKAAAEMKERIIKTLKGLASADTSNKGTNTLRYLLVEEINLAEQEIALRSATLLSAVLHNYSDFAIGTIDSFVHRIVRTFAHDLNLPINFDVDMDEENLLGQASALMLSKVGTDEKLTKAMIDFVESRSDDEKKYDVQDELYNFAKNLLKDDGRENLKKLKQLSFDQFFLIRDEIAKKKKVFENEIIADAEKALSILIQSGVARNDFFNRGVLWSYFVKITNYDFKEVLIETGQVHDMMFENKSWYAAKLDAGIKNAIDAVKPAVSDLFHKIYKKAKADLGAYIMCTELYKKVYSLALLTELDKTIQEYKNENGIMHISEFSELISKITLEQPVPFIYERIGEKYNHYLLDEFQDTSVLQWYNLLPLVENALSKGFFNMIVGDGKQAIYRWRGGEVALFSNLPNVIGSEKNNLLTEKEELLKQTYKAEQLTHNRRSKKEIVDFNNKLYRFLSANYLSEELKPIYYSLEQEFDENSIGGSVTIDMIGNDGDNVRENILTKTLEHIKSVIACGYSYSDIAIIVRQKDNGAAVAAALKAAEIETISPDSLLIAQNNEVNFIFSFFNAIANSNDIISSATVINWLVTNKKINYTDYNTAHRIFKEESNSNIFKFLSAHGFDFNKTHLVLMPVYEMCSALVTAFSLHNISPVEVQFLLDEIFSFTKKNSSSLPDLITWWEKRKKKSALVIPENANAVRILTIHKSKGLEYPVVIMPFADWQISKTTDDAWIDASSVIPDLNSALIMPSKVLLETKFAHVYENELANTHLDNLNLLYVATTRAVDHLFIISSSDKKAQYLNSWLKAFLNSTSDYVLTETTYRFGSTMFSNENKKEVGNSFALQARSPIDWREKIKLKSNSKYTDSSALAEKGILMHDLLSRIKSAEEIDEALSNMLSEGLISLQEKEELNKNSITLFQNPDFAKFFDGTFLTKNEQEIILPDGTVIRPDKIIIDGETATVVDFKTGKEDEKHSHQLKKYTSALIQMGFKKTEAFIVYTESNTVKSLQ